MAGSAGVVIGGVDTHGRTHQAAAIDATGRVLGIAEFEASARGYRELVSWLRGHGTAASVGVEGPAQGSKLALRTLARRIEALDAEIRELDAVLDRVVRDVAPATTSLLGIGVDHAGQLLVTAGHNPDRPRSEAAFARLCGAAPMPASSGRHGTA